MSVLPFDLVFCFTNVLFIPLIPSSLSLITILNVAHTAHKQTHNSIVYIVELRYINVTINKIKDLGLILTKSENNSPSCLLKAALPRKDTLHLCMPIKHIAIQKRFIK